MNLAELDPVVIRGLSGNRRRIPAQDTLVTPFSEGAKARAIVDFCAREGLAAYFLDAGGRVIVANAAASAIGSDGLSIEWGEFRAKDENTDFALKAAVATAVAGGAMKRSPGTVEIRDGSGASVFLTCLRYQNASPFQKLKAVVLIGRDRAVPLAKRKALVDLLVRG